MANYKLRNLLKLNTKFLLEQEFLRDGLYSNIVSGQVFYTGEDMSVLLADTDAVNQFVSMSPGQIWQSAFRNWVYESGVRLNSNISLINKTPPFVCSGVYINNVFKATSPTHPSYDASYKHTIDFINGRVIFDTALPLTTKVQADFAYKHVRVDFEYVLNNQIKYGVLQSKFTTNPLTPNQLVYPSGLAQPFPAVFIDVDNRTWDAYELGNRSLISHDTVRLNVWALDDMTRDNIVDIISYQMRKNIPGIDFNIAPLPLSGIFNTLSPEYVPYQTLLTNPRIYVPAVNDTRSAIQYTIHWEQADPANQDFYAEFERAVVIGVLRTQFIHPISPIGIATSNYGFGGGTTDF